MWSPDQTRMWVVENSVSFLFVLKVSRLRSRWSPCTLQGSTVLEKVKARNLPYRALSSTFERSHISVNFSWVKCVRILSRYYPDLRRCSERFPTIYRKFPKMFRRSPNVVECVQRLLKVSKDSHDAFGHSKLENSNTTFRAIYSRTPVTRTLKGSEKQFELAGFRVIGSIEYSICHVNNW